MVREKKKLFITNKTTQVQLNDSTGLHKCLLKRLLATSVDVG